MPDQKFTSSRDILLVVYFMVKNAQFKEKMQATESEAAEQQSSTPKEKGTQAGNWKQMLEQEADRQTVEGINTSTVLTTLYSM